MKRHKFWIFINSLFAFISAYIFVRAVVMLNKYLIIQHFEGDALLYNFRLQCINSPSSGIWTSLSVKSIYFTGFLIPIVIIPIAYGFFKAYQKNRGIIKLWFLWVFIIAISQSIGLFIRDVPFNYGIYHALNWSYISVGGMIVIIVISIPVLIILNYRNISKFLKNAPSSEYIKTPKLKRKFYNRVALFPAITGSLILLGLNWKTVEDVDVVEKLVIILCIAVSYLHFFKRKPELYFKRVKNETTDRINYLVIIVVIVKIISYFIIKDVYF